MYACFSLSYGTLYFPGLSYKTEEKEKETQQVLCTRIYIYICILYIYINFYTSRENINKRTSTSHVVYVSE